MHHLVLMSGRPEGQKVNVIEWSSSVIGGLIDGLAAWRVIILSRSFGFLWWSRKAGSGLHVVNTNFQVKWETIAGFGSSVLIKLVEGFEGIKGIIKRLQPNGEGGQGWIPVPQPPCALWLQCWWLFSLQGTRAFLFSAPILNQEIDWKGLYFSSVCNSKKSRNT